MHIVNYRWEDVHQQISLYSPLFLEDNISFLVCEIWHPGNAAIRIVILVVSFFISFVRLSLVEDTIRESHSEELCNVSYVEVWDGTTLLL